MCRHALSPLGWPAVLQTRALCYLAGLSPSLHIFLPLPWLAAKSWPPVQSGRVVEQKATFCPEGSSHCSLPTTKPSHPHRIACLQRHTAVCISRKEGDGGEGQRREAILREGLPLFVHTWVGPAGSGCYTHPIGGQHISNELLDFGPLHISPHFFTSRIFFCVIIVFTLTSST